MPWLLMLTAAVAPMSEVQFDAARRRMPADVRVVLDRWEGCNHWSGEEPYDRVRGRQIDRALATLRCARLPRDVEVVRRRHARQGDVKQVPAAAHALFD